LQRSVQLSEQQRVIFYEFVTASLRAAETLVTACPAATALIPCRCARGDRGYPASANALL